MKSFPRLFWPLLLVWLGCLGLGFGLLLRYEHASGAPARAPVRWPDGSRIVRDEALPTLVLFAHPQCPCTRASIAELARLMRHVQGRVAARVLFTEPAPFDSAWTASTLWRQASAIPGVGVARDPDGREAHRFGTFTSGQVLLYDTAGRLQFEGGITASRGHEGDNTGRAALLALLTARPAPARETAVFGCSLFAPDACRDDRCSRP